MDKVNPIHFKIKSTKGQDVSINYTPEGFVVPEKKEFEGYLLRIVDLLQCSGLGVPKPKENDPAPDGSAPIKSIEEVAGEDNPEDTQADSVVPVNEPQTKAKDSLWEGGLFDEHAK